MGERALSERWIDERAALLADGRAPTQRYLARARDVSIGDGRGVVALVSPAVFVANLVADTIEAEQPGGRWAEVALYPRAATSGALPVAIAPFPLPAVAALAAQHGEVDVRGEAAPGRGLVLVLDDGTPLACLGPAAPPPAFTGRRRHRLP